MENLDLQEIRKKLDGIDNQLVELFGKKNGALFRCS